MVDLINPALSLFVDGEEVREAAVFTREEYSCYPCMSQLIEVSKELVPYILKMMELGFLKPLHSFAIVYLRKGNILSIPLLKSRVLILILNPRISGERTARDLMDVLRRLTTVKQGDVDAYEEHVFEDHMEADDCGADVYRYLATYVVDRKLAKKAMVVIRKSIVFSYPEIIEVPIQVIETLVDVHTLLYKKQLRYISIRLGTERLDIVLIPIEVEVVLLLEVSSDMPTKQLMKMIHLRY